MEKIHKKSSHTTSQRRTKNILPPVYILTVRKCCQQREERKNKNIKTKFIHEDTALREHSRRKEKLLLQYCRHTRKKISSLQCLLFNKCFSLPMEFSIYLYGTIMEHIACLICFAFSTHHQHQSGYFSYYDISRNVAV